MEKFTTVYSPGKELSLDEAMLLWRGRLSFRQYLKNNRHTTILQPTMSGTLQSKRTGNPIHVTVMKWRDKRNVLTISTMHGPTMENVKNRRGCEVLKPSMIVDYNRNMSSVDRNNQMIIYYSTLRKSIVVYEGFFPPFGKALFKDG